MGFLHCVMTRLVLLITVLHCDPSASSTDVTLEPGHLKEFGKGRPSHPLEEIDGFPNTKTFYEDYVLPLKPVVFRGAGKVSPAFDLWKDEYFINMHIPKETNRQVVVESRKKENRTYPAMEMDFKEFVLVYNHTDQYMVNAVPSFLGKDLVLPGPLQCKQIIEELLIEALMWFSSGGTKSVVHTDSVDNMNCLFRGEKTFIMVDPYKYGDKVDIDHPEGAYSDVDVDKVDYTKYPGLAEVEFYHANISAGDCLYIPYKWIHQVRSYNHNIAVNIWWDHYKNRDVDLDKCSTEIDSPITLDTILFRGLSSVIPNIEEVRSHFLSITKQHKHFTESDLEDFLLNEVEEGFFEVGGSGYTVLLHKIFEELDQNKDGEWSHEEIEDATSETWDEVDKIFQNLMFLVSKIQDKMENQYHSQNKENEYGDRDLNVVDKDEL